MAVPQNHAPRCSEGSLTRKEDRFVVYALACRSEQFKLNNEPEAGLLCCVCDFCGIAFNVIIFKLRLAIFVLVMSRRVQRLGCTKLFASLTCQRFQHTLRFRTGQQRIPPLVIGMDLLFTFTTV